MAIPAKTTAHIAVVHRIVPADNIFYGSCKEVAVVRKSSSEWRAIVEVKGRVVPSKAELCFKRLDLVPVVKYLFLHGRKVQQPLGYVKHVWWRV